MRLSGTTPVMFKLLVLLLPFTSILFNAQSSTSSLTAECLTSETCFCDQNCHEYDDCCASVNGSQPVLSPEQDAVEPACVSHENVLFEDSFDPNDLYVNTIVQCPPNQEIDVEIKAKCDEANLDLILSRKLNLLQWFQRNIRLAVPVIGADRRIYANEFCAMCNGIKRDQAYFSPVKVGCRKDGNATSCLVSINLPRSFARTCIIKARGLGMHARFVSMENIFLIPAEYLTNEYIKLPFLPNDEKNATLLKLRSRAASTEENVNNDTNEVYTWLQIILFIFSIVGLTLMLVVYGSNSILRRSLAGLLTMGLAVALLAMEVSFLIMAFGVPHAENRGFCVFMAAMLLFSLLSSFMWMMLMAFQLLITFGDCKNCCIVVWRFITCRWIKQRSASIYSHGYHHGSPKKRFLKYSCLAIFLPLCLVLPAVAVNEKVYNLLAPIYANLTNSTSVTDLDEAEAIATESPSITNITRVKVLGSSLAITDPGFCPDSVRAWFTNLSGLTVWFLVPAATMITFNFVALVIVCVQICRLSRDTKLSSSPQNEEERKRRKKSKNLVGICGKLAIILGVSWFAQLFAGWWPHLLAMRRILALVNSAQGGVIAISMLASVKARRALANMLPESVGGLIAPVSTTTQSGSKERETSGTSKTWTSVLLPRRNRPSHKTSN
ncbi:hypothetical protein Aperf_G00000029581 [Anoplocephala perfoliata]